MENEKYQSAYSEGSFWAKLKKAALVAGKEVVEKALILYYALRDPDTPTWAKGVLIAALGYFISPIDAIPDMIPGAGYGDDLGVLAAALTTVAAHIKKEHIEQARGSLTRWFRRESLAGPSQD